MSSTDTQSATDSATFKISRLLDAPRELAFEVWATRRHLEQWWGPKGMTTTVESLNFVPGGLFHYKITAPEGEMWGRFIYGEISAPARLTFTDSFSAPDGSITRAPFNSLYPLEINCVVNLEEQEGKTLLTIQATPHNATEAERKFFQDLHTSMIQGWGGTLEQLSSYLVKLQQR